MTISVDPDRCYGSGDCAYRVPSVFTVADGFGAVVPGREEADDDPALREAVREALEACPSRAITSRGGDGA
ncbi:ferredoxin [Streptomyces sp. NPDC046805]|uniref:ferredoxin n=1 Tax=Streptomyces sp. NPDC046805 TaxID=3155134 RepID=UPI0033E641B4